MKELQIAVAEHSVAGPTVPDLLKWRVSSASLFRETPTKEGMKTCGAGSDHSERRPAGVFLLSVLLGVAAFLRTEGGASGEGPLPWTEFSTISIQHRDRLNVAMI